MTATLDSSGKLNYLSAQIETKIDAQGKRYVDLTPQNHDNLVAFGYAMELKGWDRLIRAICKIFCCCLGEGSIANMAREKLRTVTFENKDTQSISGPSPAQEQVEAPPPAPKIVEIAPKKDALRQMALRLNHLDTKFTIKLARDVSGSLAFQITHSSWYPTIQHMAKGSFTVPVSTYFSNASGQADYAQLLCKEMKKMHLTVEVEPSDIPERIGFRSRHS